MPELILHVGPHKTGTTSLQTFLLDRFGEPGAGRDWYPRRPLESPGHADLARAILGLPPLKPPAGRRAAQPAAPTASIAALVTAAEAAGCRRLLLSSEAFAMAYRRGFDDLARALAGQRVHLCFTLSPVARRVGSLWQQLVRSGEERGLSEAWDDLLRLPSVAPDLVRRFLEALAPARCSVVLVDPAGASDRLPRDFCAATGLEPGEVTIAPRRNDSLGAFELELLRVFNQGAPRRALATAPRRLLVELLRSEAWRLALPPRRLSLPPGRVASALALAERTRADLEALRAAGRIAVVGELALLTQAPEGDPAAADDQTAES